MRVEPLAPGRGLKALLRRADKIGARYAVIIGDKEIDRGVVMLRDLKQSIQREVAQRGDRRGTGSPLRRRRYSVARRAQVSFHGRNLMAFQQEYSALPPWPRTDYCGALRAADAGREVTLWGWVASRRDHGGLIFIDLRDREGILQLVFNPAHAPAAHEVAGRARSEYYVAARGKVLLRSEGTVNAELPTGEIEIAVTEAHILNSSQPPPFPVDADGTAEDVRLRYRYIDLRRPAMQRNLRRRALAVQATRSFLDGTGFVEIETPILWRATPEGARDYLVPSRVNPGRFYALPQSPQLLKQLLMVSGFDRYYQIARCFRDEDLRANRQPEFSQIDIEMTCPRVDDVVATGEGMMAEIYRRVLGIESEAAVFASSLRRGDGALRHRQARPAVRDGAQEFERRVRRHAVQNFRRRARPRRERFTGSRFPRRIS